MANSSYLSYLPPVLWVPENDPQQLLGRHLRVYEKILTGLGANGFAVRAAAPFLSALNVSITLQLEADTARFRVGDWITIQGTAERRKIVNFIGATIVLDANLAAAHPPGMVRIANLEPGQISFRIDCAEQLEAGRSLQLKQAGQNEPLLIAQVNAPFITLAFGLTQTFSLDPADVPVKVLDPIGVDHAGHHTRISSGRSINCSHSSIHGARAPISFPGWPHGSRSNCGPNGASTSSAS
ncbi:MAG: hypothetical protein QM760_10825 [Nibricoccus sp.]